MSLFEGFHTPTQQAIMIKQYTFPNPSKLAKAIKEQFCQAKLRHSHFCDIIDVEFCENTQGFELCLCLERLEKDLEKEIDNKRESKSQYTEEEIWQFLQCTVEAMALAQTQVVLYLEYHSPRHQAKQYLRKCRRKVQNWRLWSSKSDR